MGYTQKCPNCGQPLQAVALDAHTAPWLCSRCCLGFWVAELEQAHLWDHTARCFRHAGHATRRAAVEQEIRDARVRGTSLREDQLGLVDEATLRHLAKRGGDVWRKSVVAAGAARGIVLSDGIPVAPAGPVVAP